MDSWMHRPSWKGREQAYDCLVPTTESDRDKDVETGSTSDIRSQASSPLLILTGKEGGDHGHGLTTSA